MNWKNLWGDKPRSKTDIEVLIMMLAIIALSVIALFVVGI
jgi:hypothetical protein